MNNEYDKNEVYLNYLEFKSKERLSFVKKTFIENDLSNFNIFIKDTTILICQQSESANIEILDLALPKQIFKSKLNQTITKLKNQKVFT